MCKITVLICYKKFLGLAFTSSCSQCPAGTFSNAGAQKCEVCRPNTFSQKGSNRCEICPDSNKYSQAKASECKLRPKCETTDFYQNFNQNECKTTNLTRIRWQQIQPKICSKQQIMSELKEVINSKNFKIF